MLFLLLEPSLSLILFEGYVSLGFCSVAFTQAACASNKQIKNDNSKQIVAEDYLYACARNLRPIVNITVDASAKYVSAQTRAFLISC